MREKEFTKGPWTVTEGLSGVSVYGVRDDGSACVCGINDLWMKDTRQHANANLIAAAPELLEALEMMKDAFSVDIFSTDEFKQIESAIAKAYGERT